MKKSVQIKLIKNKGTTTDDWGNPIPVLEEWTVFAERMSVGQSEFYRAASQGLKPSLVFEIYEDEFRNADLIVYADNEYSIIRTYQRTLDKLEVVCERKIADGN